MIKIKAIKNHEVSIGKIKIGSIFKYKEGIYMRVRMNKERGIPCLRLDEDYIISYLNPKDFCIQLLHIFSYEHMNKNGHEEMINVDNIKPGEPFEDGEGLIFVKIPLETTHAYICLTDGNYYIDVEPYPYTPSHVIKVSVTFQVERKWALGH